MTDDRPRHTRNLGLKQGRVFGYGTDFLGFSIEDGILEVVPRDHFKQARDKFDVTDADGFCTLAQP